MFLNMFKFHLCVAISTTALCAPSAGRAAGDTTPWTLAEYDQKTDEFWWVISLLFSSQSTHALVHCREHQSFHVETVICFSPLVEE
jgi:hypothetical protein